MVAAGLLLGVLVDHPAVFAAGLFARAGSERLLPPAFSAAGNTPGVEPRGRGPPPCRSRPGWGSCRSPSPSARWPSSSGCAFWRSSRGRVVALVTAAAARIVPRPAFRSPTRRSSSRPLVLLDPKRPQVATSSLVPRDGPMAVTVGGAPWRLGPTPRPRRPVGGPGTASGSTSRPRLVRRGHLRPAPRKRPARSADLAGATALSVAVRCSSRSWGRTSSVPSWVTARREAHDEAVVRRSS